MLLNRIKRYNVLHLLLIIVAFLFSLSCNSENRNLEEINQALFIAAEDLNNVLPQRQGLDLFLDSVTVSPNRMNYYYSYSGITTEQYNEESMRDSLYNAAVERIPCSLWRPEYMQNVDVTFLYFSSDGEKLYQFTESQTTCH